MMLIKKENNYEIDLFYLSWCLSEYSALTFVVDWEKSLGDKLHQEKNNQTE